MKATNKKYSIRNWSEYNKPLKKRGSITFWLSPDAIEKWFSDRTTKKGRPKINELQKYDLLTTMNIVQL